jgi:RNA polymerase sigma-70 factor (ECF subfamily)
VDRAERLAALRVEGTPRRPAPRARGSGAVRAVGDAPTPPRRGLNGSGSGGVTPAKPAGTTPVTPGGTPATAAPVNSTTGTSTIEAPEAAADAALILRVRQGDVAAYATVVHRHMRSAFAIAYHVLQHREDAEDVVQQSFMAALARLDTFDVTRPFAPWFGRVVLNHARSARRSRDRIWRRSSEPAELLEAPATAAPDRRAEDSEIRTRVRVAMNMLPERQRLAIQLIEIDGYTPAEVATMLDLAPVTMRWHLMAARRTLRRLLAPLARGHTLGNAAATAAVHAAARRNERTDRTVSLPEPSATLDSADAGPDYREAADARHE